MIAPRLRDLIRAHFLCLLARQKRNPGRRSLLLFQAYDRLREYALSVRAEAETSAVAAGNLLLDRMRNGTPPFSGDDESFRRFISSLAETKPAARPPVTWEEHLGDREVDR